jgi:hypothetical protein
MRPVAVADRQGQKFSLAVSGVNVRHGAILPYPRMGRKAILCS